MDLSGNNYKRSLEYLFYGVDTNNPNEIFRGMEEGFQISCPKDSDQPTSCISLVNSVASADIGRIN